MKNGTIVFSKGIAESVVELKRYFTSLCLPPRPPPVAKGIKTHNSLKENE